MDQVAAVVRQYGALFGLACLHSLIRAGKLKNTSALRARKADGLPPK